jgi:hypothetical protein
MFYPVKFFSFINLEYINETDNDYNWDSFSIGIIDINNAIPTYL